MNDPSERDLVDGMLADWDSQRPDLHTEPMEIILRVQTLARLFHDRASEALEIFDLQWWQYDVLSALRRQGEPYRMAASDLAAAGMLTSGAMTNRIDRLEEASLVRRTRDDADRRRVLVQLTDRGLRIVDRASDARFEAANASLAGLTDDESRRLGQLLRVLLISLEHEQGAYPV